MSPRRRVLLISPIAELDPPNGDVVYTQGLLDHPPPGVEYETYPEALESGRLEELARRDEFSEASGLERLRAFGRISRERGINAARRRAVLFREPFRYFAVRSGAYDLVHCHVFCAAFPGLDAPLVMGGSAVIEEFYASGLGWNKRRVALASKADAALAKHLGVQHTSHGMPLASAMVCQTEVLRQELLRRRSVQPDRLHVAPCFVEAGPRQAARARPNRIGFIAGEFEAKGGPVVLEAFELVRRERPDVELTVIGSEPRGESGELQARGITWLPRVARAELLEKHMPTFDAFAYPTNFDGLPLTVLEIMARGIPIATDDYQAMPEVVGYGQAGTVTPQGDACALAKALLQLLSPQENSNARRRAAEWFDTHYAPDVAVDKLRGAYESALASPLTGR
jgi:glycosyltransferase involved in cell wall biosynthesis